MPMFETMGGGGAKADILKSGRAVAPLAPLVPPPMHYASGVHQASGLTSVTSTTFILWNMIAIITIPAILIVRTWYAHACVTLIESTIVICYIMH